MAKNIQPFVQHKIISNPAMFAAVADIYKEMGFVATNTLQGQKLAKVTMQKKSAKVVLVHRIA